MVDVGTDRAGEIPDYELVKWGLPGEELADIVEEPFAVTEELVESRTG